MANSETLIPIPGRLHSVATEGHVAGADEIIDDNKNKLQSTINADVDTAIGTDSAEGTIKGRIKSLETLVGSDSVSTQIDNKINALDASESQTAGADGLALSITETDGKITAISGSIAANTYDASGAASAVQTALLGDAATDYNTLGKCEDKIQENAGDIDDIEAMIPNQASSSNQLADKSFVNSSIATSTATFRGTSATGLTEQEFLAWANALTKDDNDYVFWNTVDSDGNTQFKRYKYDGTQWSYEYTLNNSSFTSAQWAAIQSGITSNLVDKLTDLPTNASLTTTLGNKADVTSTVSSVSYDTTNKKIQETINGTTTDVVTASTLIADGGALPLTGGTMTGTLTLPQLTMYGGTSGTREFDIIKSESNKNIDIGWNWNNADGAYLALRSADHNNGEFVLGAVKDSNTSTALKGTPNGTLTWGENFVYHLGNLKAQSEKTMTPSGTSLAGWYRVATIVNGHGESFLLSIEEGYTHGVPVPSTFIIHLGSQAATIRQLGAAVTNPTHISTVRIVGNSEGQTTYYIDLYYTYSSTSVGNNQAFTLVNLSRKRTTDHISIVDWTPQAASDSLPSGEVLYASANVSTTFNADYATSANSATKLATSRTLWGQSFNGTSAVKGDIYMISSASGATSVSASARIKFASMERDKDKINAPYIQANPITGASSYGRKRLGFFQCNDASYEGTYTEAVSILPNGNVGIGTTSPASGYKMEVNGSAKATAWDTGSDERLKDIIEDKQLSLDDIADAPLFSFKYKNQENDTATHVGTTAQYWKNVLPEVVTEDDTEEKYLSLSYQSMNTAMCISLAREVKRLAQKVVELEAKLGDK